MNLDELAARECAPGADELRAYRGDAAIYWRARCECMHAEYVREREHNAYLRDLVYVLACEGRCECSAREAYSRKIRGRRP